MLRKALALQLYFLITLLLVGCHSGLIDAGNVITKYGDEFHILSRSSTTGDMYYLTQDDSLFIEVGTEEIKSSDFKLIYESDNVKAYLFYDVYILVSDNKESFQLVDENFSFSEMPEVDEMICSNLLRDRGTLFVYYDIFMQRQPKKLEILKEAYEKRDYDKLKEFGLPIESGPREEIMITLKSYIK